MRKYRDLAECFWSKVDVRGPDECWLWTGARTAKGYGNIGISKDGKFRAQYAHRLSYVLQYGEIPPGLCILHSCDVPACVNPKHLRTGTKRENAQDSKERGTNPQWTRTTQAQRKEIAQRYAAGETSKALAKEYGLNTTTVLKYAKAHGAVRTFPSAKLSPQQYEEICKRQANGESVTAIASEYGITRETVSVVKRRLREMA